LRFRAYRSALLSNFATGWSAFGLRVALVPLFVSDVMHRSVGMAGVVLAAFAAGNAVASSQWLPVRPDGTAHVVDPRPDGVRCGVATLAWRRVVLSAFIVAACVVGATTGIYMSPMQAAVADILRSERGRALRSRRCR